MISFILTTESKAPRIIASTIEQKLLANMESYLEDVDGIEKNSDALRRLTSANIWVEKIAAMIDSDARTMMHVSLIREYNERELHRYHEIVEPLKRVAYEYFGGDSADDL